MEDVGRQKTQKTRGLREAIEPTAPNENGVSEACVLLRAGMNKTAQAGRAGGREYTPDFIREHLTRFDGALSHMDHPSLTESKDRPERTMGTLAAVVKNPRWDDMEKAAVGDLHYLGTDAGRNMREAFADETVRAHAGLSIYWPGAVKVTRKRLGESYVDVPVELLGEGQFNVDFVTRPNAGGRVGPLRESEEDMEIADVTVEMLETERPELVAALREGYVPKPEEKIAPEPEATPVAESDRIAALESELAKERAGRILREKLSEAALPVKAADLVLAHFAEAEAREGFAESVDAEIARVKELAESLSEAGRVRGVTPEPKAEGAQKTVNVLKDLSEAGKPAQAEQ